MRYRKFELGYRTSPHANWSWTGFPEEHPNRGFTASSDVKVAFKGTLENHTALEVLFGKMTSNDFHMLWTILCNCRWIPVKDQSFPWAQWLAFVNSVHDICSHIFGWLRTAGPPIVANARFWNFNRSGRSLIQFVANAASSRMLNLARSKKSLISAYCRYCGAWIESTFALDIQSPKTARTWHFVGTTRSREAGSNSSERKRLPKCWKIHLGLLPRKRVHWQWYFFWKYCTFFNHKIFPFSDPRTRNCFQPSIWYSALAKRRRYCCHITSFLVDVFSKDSWEHHNNLGVL